MIVKTPYYNLSTEKDEQSSISYLDEKSSFN